MSKSGHHREGSSSLHPGHTPAWMRLHHDWRFWAAVILMFGAMIVYLMSDNLAWRPGLRPQAPLPPAVGQQ